MDGTYLQCHMDIKNDGVGFAKGVVVRFVKLQHASASVMLHLDTSVL